MLDVTVVVIGICIIVFDGSAARSRIGNGLEAAIGRVVAEGGGVCCCFIAINSAEVGIFPPGGIMPIQ